MPILRLVFPILVAAAALVLGTLLICDALRLTVTPTLVLIMGGVGALFGLVIGLSVVTTEQGG